MSRILARLHPASLLLAWGMLLLSLLRLEGTSLVVALVVVLGIALLVCPAGLGRILKRSRWLLLATLIAFGWMTPGMPVPGVPGATSEGLGMAVQQIARLSVSIGMTAMLLDRMPFPSLIAAMRGLAFPLTLLGIEVDRGTVRLALTLESLAGEHALRLRHADIASDDSSCDQTRIVVPGGRTGPMDVALIGFTLAIILSFPAD